MIASLPSSEIEALLDEMGEAGRKKLAFDWSFWARPKQLPPPGEWFVWLLMAGRGFGKTRAGAEWVIQRAKEEKGPIALIGETAGDVRDTMVELGDSAIMKISPPDFQPEYEPSKRRLTWPNGVTATTFSGEKPAQLRGPQHQTVWADEPAKWKYGEEAWDNMEMGLRLGDDPRCVATTTPRPTPLIRSLYDDDDCEVVTGTTYENEANLSSRYHDRVVAKYEGTRLGRQELHAELLTDSPGALWNHQLIEDTRCKGAPPAFERVVVGVDPSGGGDAIGIVVGALGVDGHGYILEDSTTSGSPHHWGTQAVNAYKRHSADRIVAERNFGGDMVESTIRTVSPRVSVKMVTASRGKQRRAEPVAALYEQGKIHHVGGFPDLEDEMTTYDNESSWSPNRLDALVWAGTELMLGVQRDLPQRPRSRVFSRFG